MSIRPSTGGASRSSLVLLVAAALVTVCPRPAAGAGEADEYASELIRRARAAELAQARQWLRLGHWRRSGWSSVWFAGRLAGWNSQADGADLFLAEDGRHSPEAELEATLRGFFRPAPAGDEHPICRFPARFQWLHRQLEFDLARLPVVRCQKLEEYLQSLQADAAIVVFSAYYADRSASAFGHTFLRIEKKAPFAGTERRQLLDTGIDYTAHVTTSNTLLYVVLGLTGGFRGTFRKLPYYYKVRQYNDYETRDLWEYRLDLTADELSMLVAHLWELGHTYFDYFYLTENCSYHILSAVEVARPKIDLLAAVKTPVIPADTIKALVAVPGLVSKIEYRPSLMTQFRQRTRGMSAAHLDLVERLVYAPDVALPETLAVAQRIAVLDAAADLIDIRHGKTILADTRSRPARMKQRLLERRAEIPHPSAELVIEPPWRKQPHVGHGTRRVAAGAGFMAGRGAYASMQYRATLHDLADPARGYPELSQIEFLPLEVRFSLDDYRLRLERGSLVRITHLNARDRFNQRLSWHLDVGAVRLHDAGCDGCLAASLAVAGGIARATAGRRVTGYVMVESRALGAPGLSGVAGAPIRLGLGPSAGLRLRLTDGLIALASGQWIWLPEQEPFAMWSAGGTLRWQLWPDLAVDMAVRSVQASLDVQVSAMLYY